MVKCMVRCDVTRVDFDNLYGSNTVYTRGPSVCYVCLSLMHVLKKSPWIPDRSLPNLWLQDLSLKLQRMGGTCPCVASKYWFLGLWHEVVTVAVSVKYIYPSPLAPSFHWLLSALQCCQRLVWHHWGQMRTWTWEYPNAFLGYLTSLRCDEDIDSITIKRMYDWIIWYELYYILNWCISYLQQRSKPKKCRIFVMAFCILGFSGRSSSIWAVQVSGQPT